MIYHITTPDRWNAALTKGFYEAVSLSTEGFIHASREGQVKVVLERYFQNQPGLIILHIDESKLMAELKYELAPTLKESFPHIFGTINTDAVVKTTHL